MSGTNIARNYTDVQSLVREHQNSLLEVNNDGSIRTQNIKEKLGNLGARIFGKFEARRAEKDARVKDAIVQLFNKTGLKADSYSAPQRDRLFDRFFKPVPLPSRKVEREVSKVRTGAVFIEANNNNQDLELTAHAQGLLFNNLASSLEGLAGKPEYRAESSQIHDLVRIVRGNAKEINPGNAGQKLNQLKQDLQPLGLSLGLGELVDYDISKGVVQWAQQNAPAQLK